jgi:hypothetical protein
MVNIGRMVAAFVLLSITTPTPNRLFPLIFKLNKINICLFNQFNYLINLFISQLSHRLPPHPKITHKRENSIRKGSRHIPLYHHNNNNKRSFFSPLSFSLLLLVSPRLFLN